MLQEKAGMIAGQLWTALSENGESTLKQVKKVTKLTEKEIYLGLGWLLREDKVCVVEQEKDLIINLK